MGSVQDNVSLALACTRNRPAIDHSNNLGRSARFAFGNKKTVEGKGYRRGENYLHGEN